MKMPCIKCKSKKTKVSKKKEIFTLNCLDCDNQLPLIQKIKDRCEPYFEE